MTLMNQGAEVLAFHTGSTAVMVAAQERGRLAVAYHSDMSRFAPDAQIAAVTHHWGDYYTQRVQAVQGGTWASGHVWGGVREGMIRVEGFGPKVPPAVRSEVLARQAEMAAGKVTVFAGGRLGVKDNTGRLVIAPGQALSDADILNMDWAVAGVVGRFSP
jgi:basic membrane protein A